MATPLGHILDANTAFLWRFDEEKTGYPSRLIDSGTLGIHALATTNARSALMRDYGPNGEAVRYFPNPLTFAPAPTQTHVGANNATTLAACKTQLTIEFFLRWTSGQSSTLFTMGGSNALVLRCDILQTGYCGLFWEITGVDQSVTQTAGTPFVADTWCHVGIVKRTTHVDFYLDGVLQQSVARTASPGGIGEPNGASSALEIGSNRGVNLGFHGSCKDLKITTRPKTAGEIATAAALLNTTFELPLEVDTLCLWRMDDTEAIVVDSGPNEMTLYHQVTPAEPTIVSGLIGNVGGKSLHFGWDTVLLSHGYGDAFKGTPVQAFYNMLLSAFTFECWIRMGEPRLYAQHGLWCWGDPGLTTAIANFLTVDVLFDGRIQWWSEHGTDLDSVLSTSAAIPLEGTHHLALRRNETLAGAHTVDVFVDGAYVESMIGIVPFNNGNGPVQQFFIGYGANEGSAYFFGQLDDVRFSNIARTDAEILESYNRGIGYEAPVVVLDPLEISNITPIDGEITPGEPGAFSASFRTARLTPITFDVSNIPDGYELTIAVKYENRNETYVARDAEGSWQWPFDVEANNTMADVVSNDSSVSMLPRGGWPPTRVEFKVSASIMAVQA